MGFLKPTIESEQPKSQATPLAEDLLSLLREQLGAGKLGEGVGAPQREAGANIKEFINARETPARFEELMRPLRESFNRDTDRNAAAQRESFSLLGGRLGTPLAREEGILRGNRANDLDSMISQLFLQDQNTLLGAIGQQQQFGNQNLAPFLQLGGAGILPEQLFAQDSDFMAGLKALTSFSGGANEARQAITGVTAAAG